MPRHVRSAIFVFSLTVLPFAPAAAGGGEFVAATYSDRFHRVECKVAAKIDETDRVYFAAPENAAAAGFVPCKKCEPAAKDD